MWLSAGAIVFDQARVETLDLGYAHVGLLDIGSVAFGKGVTATGLHVDAIGGDVQALTGKMGHGPDAAGAFHSIEAALRSGGRYSDANTVAYEGSWLTAGIAGKLTGQGAAFVIGLLAAFLLVAALCCKPSSKDIHWPFRVFLCALDIVLPSFVDIGALSAWTNYDDAAKENVAVRIDDWYRTTAFVMRILGTLAFTYLLLYVANLRA